jgi:hypothetical protein
MWLGGRCSKHLAPADNSEAAKKARDKEYYGKLREQEFIAEK